LIIPDSFFLSGLAATIFDGYAANTELSHRVTAGRISGTVGIIVFYGESIHHTVEAVVAAVAGNTILCGLKQTTAQP